MLALNPGDPPRIIATIPEHVPLVLTGASQSVRITYETYIHIVENRLKQGDEQVALVLNRIDEVLTAPSHYGRRTDDGRRVDFYKRSAGDSIGVLVCVKCLFGETWVSTAWPVGERTLRKYLGQGRLLPVSLPLFGDTY